MQKRLILASLALVVAVLGFYFYMREVVFPNPANCNVCHFITPFYKKWQTSTHNKVPCLKCHDYAPINAVSGQLKFLTGTYHPRPLTRVPDKNCLQSGCHERRLIESTVMFTKNKILFDHLPHFTEMRRGIKLHCRSCHSDIVQGEHVKVSVNVCYLCHFKADGPDAPFLRCTACHAAPPEGLMVGGKPFSHEAALVKGRLCRDCHTGVVQGEGMVPQDRCFFCHVEKTELYEDVNFIHNEHVAERQIDCLFCHPKIEHKETGTPPVK